MLKIFFLIFSNKFCLFKKKFLIISFSTITSVELGTDHFISDLVGGGMGLDVFEKKNQ